MSFQLAARLLTHGYRPVYYRGPQQHPLPQSVVDYQRAIEQRSRELAIHESGHAVISLVLGQPLWKVQINPQDGTGICYATPPSAASLESNSLAFADACAGWQSVGVTDGERRFLATESVVLAAGGAAQRQYNPSADARMWLSDDYKIEAVANIVHDEPDRARRFAVRQRKQAEALVVRHRSEIAAVAAALAEKLELTGDRVRTIVHGSRRGSALG
jgi:ATP-dependent Zn protease